MHRLLLILAALSIALSSGRPASALPIGNTGATSLGLSSDVPGPVVITTKSAVPPDVLRGVAHAVTRVGRDVVMSAGSEENLIALCVFHRAAAVVTVQELTGSFVADVRRCDKPVVKPKSTTPEPRVVAQLRWQQAPSSPVVKVASTAAIVGMGMTAVGYGWGIVSAVCALGWEPGRDNACGALGSRRGPELLKKSGLVLAAGAGLIAITTTVMNRARAQESSVQLAPVIAPGMGGVGISGRF